MISRTIYEVLPTSYLILGSSTILLRHETVALMLAVLIFFLGARLYNMRSQNRRSDPARKRQRGVLPFALYNLMPFIFLLSATFLFRFTQSSAMNIIAIALVSYATYILIQRSNYRKHRIPQS